MPAIWSLNSAIDYCNENFAAIRNKENILVQHLLLELEKLSDIVIYDKEYERVSTIAINILGVPSNEVVGYLDKNSICSRGGIHCAILVHKELGTVEAGVVRFSLNYLNSADEIKALINVLNDCR